MSGNEDARILLAHIDKHLTILDEIATELDLALEKDVPALGRTNRTGVMVASIIESYYTCVETIFLRISQYFENNLAGERWHRELLDRMAIAVEKMRPRVLSDSVYEELSEMMWFRHFKRYYLGFSYDWERLDLLVTRVRWVHDPLKKDIAGFKEFLRTLAGEK